MNLVTGPNAVGKSSLIRALEYLAGGVRPEDPQSLVLEAEFRNEAHWTVKRTASHLQWHRDGETVDAGPRLPARDQLHCYWLRVEDLLAADGGQDVALVAEIRKALAGGFNLPALRGDEFEYGPARGRKEGRELLAARQKLNEVNADNQALQRDEQGLERLQDEADAARRGAQERDVLSRAIELAQTLSERRGLEAALTGFPAGMEKLRGDEAERLEQLDQRLPGLREDQLRIREQLASARRALADAGLNDKRPAAHELKAARQQLDTLRERAREIERQQDEMARLQAQLEVVRRPLLGPGLESRQAPDIAVATLEKARDLAVRLRKLETDIERLDSRIEAAGEAPEARQVDAHRQAIEALRDWLSGQGGGAGPSWAGPVLAALGGLGAGFAAVWLAIGWLLAPAALSLVAAVLMVRRPDGDEGQQAQRQFQRSGLDAPKQWTRSAVQARLAQLESDQAELQLARRRADAVAEDRAERDRLQRQLDSLNDKKAELAAAIGFDPALSAAGMHLFASTVSDWQRAATDLARAEAGRRRLESEQAAGLAVMQQHLKDWGMAVPADYAALEAALNDLMARVDQAEAAERDMASAGDRERALERQGEELEAERRAVFARFGSDEQDQAGLDERLARLDEWRETRDTVRALDRRERELREALSQAPERLRQAEAGEQAALEAAVHEADEQAELLEQRLQEVSAIRQQLRSAGKDQALEKAMADEALAHNALAEQYQQAMLAEAGQFLLDDVEAAYQSEHEPAVLADARQLFQRFTHHAFDVALDEEQGLMARDLKLGGHRRLSELSSGTRMQLLLSVRLAWTRQLEQQYEALPLFLDEALTTSDESRFRAVAESLSALAEEEGRQIFYLSARQQERVFWEQLAGLNPHHVDLADVRFGPAASRAADYELPPIEALPEPGDATPEQWAAKVGIPPIDVWQSPGSIPLFHLLRDDLALLYQLMQRYRVRTLGQLEALLQSDVAGRAIPDSDRRKQLAGRCKAAHVWQRACLHGRGKPVDRAALEASGAVSDTFMDRVCEQADTLNGDGQALIKALANKAISGFRNDKREELAEFLQAEGYISQETPLDAEARLQRTIWSSALAADEDDARRLVAWLEAGRRCEQAPE